MSKYHNECLRLFFKMLFLTALFSSNAHGLNVQYLLNDSSVKTDWDELKENSQNNNVLKNKKKDGIIISPQNKSHVNDGEEKILPKPSTNNEDFLEILAAPQVSRCAYNRLDSKGKGPVLSTFSVDEQVWSAGDYWDVNCHIRKSLVRELKLGYSGLLYKFENHLLVGKNMCKLTSDAHILFEVRNIYREKESLELNSDYVKDMYLSFSLREGNDSMKSSIKNINITHVGLINDNGFVELNKIYKRYLRRYSEVFLLDFLRNRSEYIAKILTYNTRLLVHDQNIDDVDKCNEYILKFVDRF